MKKRKRSRKVGGSCVNRGSKGQRLEKVLARMRALGPSGSKAKMRALERLYMRIEDE
jgi:hypothetical protein